MRRAALANHKKQAAAAKVVAKACTLKVFGNFCLISFTVKKINLIQI
jgi:hypothetical protein